MSLASDVTRSLTLVPPVVATSEVREVVGPVIRARRFAAAVGDIVSIKARGIQAPCIAQVVGFTGEHTVLTAFSGTQDILPGAKVIHTGTAPDLQLSPHLLGTAVDGLGRVLYRFAEPDQGLASLPCDSGRMAQEAPTPFSRALVREVLSTGIRAIDGFLTLGKGQRMLVLAEPGVGKSSLIGAIARHTRADINVIGLVGERGREVQEFLEDALSPEARARSVIVLSTSDESPLARASAAHLTQRLAEYFRSAGKHVLLQIDSLTRYVRALREIGLAAGEIPVRRGYPPSVFVQLPKLIERAGATGRGSITALYTVLTSANADEDPMIEELKGLTDGHIVLSKQLADLGQYPAIDILASLSRIQPKLIRSEQLSALKELRGALALFQQEKDLLALGAVPTARVQGAATCAEKLRVFLSQSNSERSSFEESMGLLEPIWRDLRNSETASLFRNSEGYAAAGSSADSSVSI